MKHIQSYYNKIDSFLAQKSNKKQRASKAAKGLLAPSSTSSSEEKKKKNDMEVVAEFVQGIRDAKKEMLHGQ